MFYCPTVSSVLFFSFEAQDCSNYLRCNNGPEVRHSHHDDHHVEHADHDLGVLRDASGDDQRLADHQHCLHRRLYFGVCAQAHRAQALLLQDPMERLRLCGRRAVYFR